MGMLCSGVMTHEELRKENCLRIVLPRSCLFDSNCDYTSLILLTPFFFFSLSILLLKTLVEPLYCVRHSRGSKEVCDVVYNIEKFGLAWKAVGFPGGTLVKDPPGSAADARDMGSISGSGRSLVKGNGYPLHYSCWRIPRTGGLQSMGHKGSDMTKQVHVHTHTEGCSKWGRLCEEGDLK